MPHVSFSNADINFLFKEKRKVIFTIKFIFSTEQKLLQHLDYIFCSDEYLLELNKRYLNHNTLTDIITFDLSEEEGIIGEIYISIPRVRDNAQNHQVAFISELRRVIFHGALHLCGYKDKTKREITIMREKEEYFLKEFDQNSDLL